MSSKRKKKVIGLTLSSLLLALCFPVEAQQGKKTFRIGYVAGRSPSTDTDVEPIRRALREIGYIEGQNIAIEYRYTHGKSDRLPELFADLVRLQVDLILVGGGDNVIRAAMNATKNIPLVLTGPGSDPVKSGFIEGLIAQAATSPALQTLATNWAASGWRYSKKLLAMVPVSQFCTIQVFRASDARLRRTSRSRRAR